MSEVFPVGTNVRVRIEQDTDPESPREWSVFGKMACWHRRYNLGDEQPKKEPTEWLEHLAMDLDPGLEEIEHRTEEVISRYYDYRLTAQRLPVRIADEYMKWKREVAIQDNCVMLPLYLYDHSGLRMSTGSFSCPWDSGQVGWIYATKEQVIKEFGEWSAESIQKAEKLLNAEVETYSQYLEGDVWGYIIEMRSDEDEEDWEDHSSCWGFFGFDYCKEEAMAIAESLKKEQANSFVNFM